MKYSYISKTCELCEFIVLNLDKLRYKAQRTVDEMNVVIADIVNTISKINVQSDVLVKSTKCTNEVSSDNKKDLSRELPFENMELNTHAITQSKCTISDSIESAICSSREVSNDLEGKTSGKKKKKPRRRRKKLASSTNKKSFNTTVNESETHISANIGDKNIENEDDKVNISSEHRSISKSENLMIKIDDSDNWLNILNKRQDQLLKEYTLNLKIITNEKVSFCNNIVEKDNFEKIKIACTFIQNFFPMGGKLDVLRCLEDHLDNAIDLLHKKNSIRSHYHSAKLKRIFREFEAEFLNWTLDDQNVSANGSHSNTSSCSQNNANKVSSECSDEKQIENSEPSHPSVSFVSSSPVQVTVEKVSCFEYAAHGIQIIKEFELNKLYLKSEESIPDIELINAAKNYLSSCKLLVLTHQEVNGLIIKHSENSFYALSEKSHELQHKASLNENDKEHYGKYLLSLQDFLEVHKKLKEQAIAVCEISEATLHAGNVCLEKSWRDSAQTKIKDCSLYILEITCKVVNISYEYMWHLRTFYEVYKSLIQLSEKMTYEY